MSMSSRALNLLADTLRRHRNSCGTRWGTCSRTICVIFCGPAHGIGNPGQTGGACEAAAWLHRGSVVERRWGSRGTVAARPPSTTVTHDLPPLRMIAALLGIDVTDTADADDVEALALLLAMCALRLEIRAAPFGPRHPGLPTT